MKQIMKSLITWVSKKRTIRAYAVGNQGCEHYMAYEYYFSKRKALKKYQEVRHELLADAKHMLDWTKKDGSRSLKENKTPLTNEPLDEHWKKYFRNKARHGDEMYREIIKKLSEPDPKKMDNYPHDEPFIDEIKIVLF